MHHHHGGHRGGGFRGGFIGYPIYTYPCDPLDPTCPYAFGVDATDLHERVPGSMSPVGDEFHSRPAGSMVPVGCDWRMKF